MRVTPVTIARAFVASAATPGAARTAIVELRIIADALAADRQVRRFFSDRSIATALQERVLRDACGTAFGALAYGLIHALLVQRHLLALGTVIARADQLLDARAGIARVKIETATGLSGPTRQHIETELATALARSIVAAYTVNPALLGGLRVTVNGTREWDCTIAGRYARLRRHVAKV